MSAKQPTFSQPSLVRTKLHCRNEIGYRHYIVTSIQLGLIIVQKNHENGGQGLASEFKPNCASDVSSYCGAVEPFEDRSPVLGTNFFEI